MHVVLYHDGSKSEVSEKIAEILMEKAMESKLQGVKVNGAFYKFSSISKILSQEEYHKQYPDKAPAPVRDQFKELYGHVQDYQSIEHTAAQSKSQSRGLISGLKRFIDEEKARGHIPKHAVAMYEQKLVKYHQTFEQDKELDEIAKSFGGEVL